MGECAAIPLNLSLDVILVTVALPLLPGVLSLTRRSSTHRTGAARPRALYWQLTRSDRFISQVGSGARLTRAFTAHSVAGACPFLDTDREVNHVHHPVRNHRNDHYDH